MIFVVYRVNGSKYHGFYFFIAGNGSMCTIMKLCNSIANTSYRNIFQSCCYVANLACCEYISRGGLWAENADIYTLPNNGIAKKLHLFVFAQCAVKNSYVCDDSFKLIILAVKYECF